VKGRTLWYYCAEDGSPDDAHLLLTRLASLGAIAEAAAEDYHANHDGWESSWPITFVILDEARKELARFLVDREAVPQFNATKASDASWVDCIPPANGGA